MTPDRLDRLRSLEGAHLMPNYRRFPVEFTTGSGAELFDSEGNAYLDLLAGIAVDNCGHCHPKVVEAIREQAGKLIHVSNLFYTEPGIRLAEVLSTSSLGGPVFLCNSGAEANEAALKLARRIKPGGGFVVLEGGFHGRTFGALSATPQKEKQEPFAPLVPGFTSVCADPGALADAIGAETAAVLIEPIQGEGGVHPIPDEVLIAAREACDRHGALMILDEVQTGAGRTGSLWAYEQTPVVPDAITVAKGVGGGMPVGALVARPGLPDTLRAGDHGSTFAGGPVTAAAALASLEVVSEPELLASVRANGERLRAGLSEMPKVEAVRGRGLMVGCDIHGDAPAVVERALFEERLVTIATGPKTLRFVPPLVISAEQVDDALERLERLLG
ncbi:MAG: acetylornithine/succinylornithine family transaminase [Actinomycetes bacterium]